MSLAERIDSVWSSLTEGQTEPPPQLDLTTLELLPAPAGRWLTRVLPPRTALTTAAELTMTGEIKIGSRWFPFTAEQIIRAGAGFVWKPIVGNRLVRFTGADFLSAGNKEVDAGMEFRLHHLLPVVRASGPDVVRSGAGRLAVETVAWLPQATTPQAGATWRPVDDTTAVVTVEVMGEAADVTVTVAADGALLALSIDRWDSTASPPASRPFGADVISEYVSEGGVRVAGRAGVGWSHGTAAWDEGEFFHFSLTSVRWL